MNKLTKILLILLIWSGFGWVLIFSYSMFVADIEFEGSQDLIDNGDYYEALKSVDRALKLNPFEPNYPRGRARINVISLTVAEKEYLSEIKKEVLEDLRKAYSLNPNNLVTIRNLIPLYYFLSVKDITVKGEPDNLDSEYAEIARGFMQNAKDRYPNDAGVYVLVAKYEKRMGLMEDYENSVARLRELRADLLDWYQL